jgi:hypothetical protein
MESTEGIFLMPRMQITSNTQALVEMAYQIMQEACDSTQQRSVNSEPPAAMLGAEAS